MSVEQAQRAKPLTPNRMNGPLLLAARRALKVNRCGDPVGYRILREPMANVQPCTAGCLAPGSSPHYHPAAVGYFVAGTRGYVELDLYGNVMACGTFYSLEE